MAFVMQGVNSSNIESVGYDDATEKMRVRFRNGKLYEYDGVSRSVYDEFLDSDSPGSYFARIIRVGGFEFRQVDSDEEEDDADEAEEDEDEDGDGDGDDGD